MLYVLIIILLVDIFVSYRTGSEKNEGQGYLQGSL